MIAQVISLAAYRAGVRVEGTTLVWHELRHDIEGPRLVDLCEALYCTNDDGKTRSAAGFRVWADRRCLWLQADAFGPATMLRGDEVRRLGIALLKAERQRVGREGPVSA